MQCGECGKWMRLLGRDADGNAVQRFAGSCSVTKGRSPLRPGSLLALLPVEVLCAASLLLTPLEAR